MAIRNDRDPRPVAKVVPAEGNPERAERTLGALLWMLLFAMLLTLALE